METRATIEEFFEEQFKDTSGPFLYKDKQLLKNGQFREYAQEQVSKAKRSFWSVFFGIFLCSYYGVIGLIEYGSEPNWYDLSMGLVAFATLFGVLFFATKEYYTVKSLRSKHTSSSYDEEKAIMDAIRQGEGDKFGY